MDKTALILAFIIALISPKSVYAASITITPSLLNVSYNNTFDVNITVSDVTDLKGWGDDISFNPNVLEVIKVTEGPFLKGTAETYWIAPVINNTLGMASNCAQVRLGNVGGVNGSGVLATVTFRAKGTGRSAIDVKNVDLSNSNASTISATITSGLVVVFPTPPTNLTINKSGMDILLDWSASITPSVTYNIYRANEFGRFDFNSPYDTSLSTSWTDVNAVNTSTEYYYIVRTTDGRNEEENYNIVGKYTMNITGPDFYLTGIPLLLIYGNKSISSVFSDLPTNESAGIFWQAYYNNGSGSIFYDSRGFGEDFITKGDGGYMIQLFYNDTAYNGGHLVTFLGKVYSINDPSFGLNISKSGNDTVLNWNELGADLYEVYISTSMDIDTSPPPNYTTTDTTWTHVGVNDPSNANYSREYYYAVKALFGSSERQSLNLVGKYTMNITGPNYSIVGWPLPKINGDKKVSSVFSDLPTDSVKGILWQAYYNDGLGFVFYDSRGFGTDFLTKRKGGYMLQLYENNKGYNGGRLVTFTGEG